MDKTVFFLCSWIKEKCTESYVVLRLTEIIFRVFLMLEEDLYLSTLTVFPVKVNQEIYNVVVTVMWF